MRGPARRAGLALALLMLTPRIAVAQPVDVIEAQDALVQTIGWRLSHANARFCPRAAPGIGLLLADMRTFTDPAATRAAYGLSGDIAVGAIAAGGPAARAGIAVDSGVEAVAGIAVGTLPEPPVGSWDRFIALQRALDAQAARGAAVLTLAGGRTVTIPAEPSCGVRFMLDTATGNAGATREQVRIGRLTVETLGGEEALVAASMAHELAHAALDHQSTVAASRNDVGVVRRTEREADRLSVWLLANAGYDPRVVSRMIRKLAPGRQIDVPSPTHGSWRERRRDMEAEIAVLRAAPDANWALRFRRETASP